jgi:hypothetical protein
MIILLIESYKKNHLKGSLELEDYFVKFYKITVENEKRNKGKFADLVREY